MQCKDVYRKWCIDSLIIESLGRDLHTDSKWIGLIACSGMGKIGDSTNWKFEEEEIVVLEKREWIL